MRKNNILLVLIFIIVIITGCGQKQFQSSKPKEGFELTEAKNEVNKYMNYIYAKDYESAKAMLSEDMQKGFTAETSSNMIITGFTITEADEIGRSGLIKVRVAKETLNNSYSELDEYSIKISKVKGNYQIEKIENEMQKEAFKSGNSIRMRIKKNGKSVLLVYGDSTPQYAYSKDDKALINKIPISDYDFGVINFAFSGSKIAISKVKNNSFLCVANIDDSIATQGGDQSGSEGQGGGSSGQSQGMGPREIPAGKEVVVLDVLTNSKVINLAFSEDERLVCAQYVKSNGQKCIKVFNSESGDAIPVDFEKEYDISKYSIIFEKFEKGSMIYNVLPKNSSKQTDVTGKWKLNLKSFKFEKIS